jgi:hypothetical protein
VQTHQTPIEPKGQQPDGQCEDKKKAEVVTIKAMNTMEMMRLVMTFNGRLVEALPGRMVKAVSSG